MCALCIFRACVLRVSVCRYKFTSIKLKASRGVQLNGYVTANKSMQCQYGVIIKITIEADFTSDDDSRIHQNLNSVSRGNY